MANPRREFLLKALNVESLKGLEIGPLNKPLVRKEDLQEGGKDILFGSLADMQA